MEASFYSNTDSTTFTVRWVIFPDKIVSSYFQIFVIKWNFRIKVWERQIISNLWTEMYADSRETFANMCADMLFKFQWHIEKHRLNTFDIGPGLIFMSPLRLIIREPTQRYSSKLDIIRRYITAFHARETGNL